MFWNCRSHDWFNSNYVEIHGSLNNYFQKNRTSLNLDRNCQNSNGLLSKDVNSKGKYFPDLPNFRMSFGTPSYPSPLDRIRCGNTERKSQFGLNKCNNASFEGNQSFPKASKTKLNMPARKLNLDNFKGKRTRCWYQVWRLFRSFEGKRL